MSLREISKYLRDTRGIRLGTVAYDHIRFYEASGDSKADVFLCIETGKQYIPCESRLQEYQMDRQEKISEVR